MKKEALTIVKIGGNVIEDPKTLTAFLELFSRLDSLKILVHGGGKQATIVGEQMGVKTKMAGGRRITDSRSLDIAIMVYAGLINKNLVAGLQARGCNALGISGADGNSIYAVRRPVREIDYGYAGDVVGVNNRTISNLLGAGFIPVFCALTHDGQGQMLNTNADTIASEVAIGLSLKYETTLYYCFEKAGVLADRDDDSSVIREIDSAEYRKLSETGTISDGMLPKLQNCFHALEQKVSRVCIGDIRMLQPGHSLFTTLKL